MNLDQWGFTHWFDRVPSEEQAHLPTELNGFGAYRCPSQALIFKPPPVLKPSTFRSQTKHQIARDWSARHPARQKSDHHQGLLQNLFTIPNSLYPQDATAACSNVDHVFILAAMDRTFNVARMERFLAAAWRGIDPVLVLTRADLVDNVEPLRSLRESH